MTEYEKQQIFELRMQGMGYKAIAATLGLTRDHVRTHCRRNGLGGSSAVVALNVEEQINRQLLCANCGKPIEQKDKGRRRRFCSEFCRRKWWREYPQERNMSKEAIYHFTCKHCGKEFTSYGNRHRKYCSHDCYIKSRFWEDENGV